MEQHLYELLRQCTVRLSVPGKVGHGTGFFVAPGLILTCAHVIMAAQSNNSSVEVYWNDQLHSAQITLSLPDPDLALLQVNLTDHPCAYLHEEAIPFDALYSYGYPDDHPGGDPATFSLEGKAGEQGEQLKFKTGQVRPGMSGAPLLNVRTGYVCGVVQLTRDRNNDLGGRAIPTTTVLRAFPESSALQQQFHQQDRRWMNCLWAVVARTRYLESMIWRYSSLTLPIGPAQGFSLQAVFQPLKLRRDPLAAEDLLREERRALLGELRNSDEDPRRAFPGSRQSRSQGRQTPPAVIAENVDDALRRSSKHSIVILGSPGTGKTVLLKYLVGDLAKQALTDPTAPLPIFISLPDFARSGKTLKEYLISAMQDMIVDERYALILWKALEQGRAFVCLDGLDEVTPQLRPEKIRLINEWASRTNSIYIVGSRFTDYKGGQLRGEQFTEWELLPLNQLLRHELVKRLLPELYRSISLGGMPIEDKASIFVSALEQHERATAWGENPLLLSLAAVVFVHSGILPSSRTTLYQQVIDAVLETRELNLTRREMLRSVLTCLALELHQQKGRTFTRNDLLRILRIVRRRQGEQWGTEEFAQRIIDSGVLELVARNTYGFRHQTFQEYLAAVELAQRLMSKDQTIQEEAWDLAWSKRTYSRWVEVLRLMVGVLVHDYERQGIQKAWHWLGSLVEQRNQPEGDPGDLGLVLALRSLSEVNEKRGGEWDDTGDRNLENEVVTTWIRELFATVRDETRQERLQALTSEVLHMTAHTVAVAVEQLIAALKSENTSRRIRQVAAEALRELGERAPIERLLPFLGDASKGIRQAAVLALGERIPVERLIALLDDEDTGVRQAAIGALGGLGERAPVEKLVTRLDDGDEYERLAAVEALGKLGERAPVERLMTLLNDTDGEVRRAAVEALGELGERVPIERLLALLEDRDPSVRSMASEALGEQRNRVPVERLMALLDHKDTGVRQTAIQVLEVLGERTPIERLVALLEDPDEFVRQSAVKAMADLGEPLARERLIELLEDPSWFVRQITKQELEKLATRDVIEQLVTNLDDRAWGERKVAVWVLGKLGERAPVEELVALLDDSNIEVQLAAVEALGELGERTPVERLVALSENAQSEVRRAAIRALSKLGELAPIDKLITLLDDSDREIRSATIHALGELGERAPIDKLIALFDDPDRRIRRAAAWALWKLGERAPIEQLQKLLKDPDEYVRTMAVLSLGQLERRELDERLLVLLEGTDEIVRRATVEAIGERIPVERLITLLNDKDNGVRSAAIEALGGLGERAPIERLIALLEETNIEVRSAGIRALGKLGARAPVKLLVDLIDDWDDRRLDAVEALRELGGYAPVEPLLMLLEDTDSSVREAAAGALENHGEQVPLQPLLTAVEDSDNQVREAAVWSLQRTHPDALSTLLSEATAILLEQGSGLLLSSPSRVLIAQTIGEMEDVSPTLLEHLTNLLCWPHWQVQSEAAEALGKLRRNIPNAAISYLYNLRLHSPSRVVREAADNALYEILSLETGIEDD